MNIVVAVTAASGSIYARLLVETLAASEEVERIALVYSENARAVAEHEGVAMPADAKIVEYSNSDLFASPASGSAAWDAMVVVPSSVGTVGRIAGGVSQTLIERAADVMLKERRRLVFVVRETPYSLVHLRNMVALTEAGAVIVPASPSFYSKPATVEELCRTVVERVVALLGIAAPHYEWGKER
ncbi:MAG: UbiX family flavin prenyltransferase [Alistipes sp.]|nr:UbiX family flavin prenyltransferase [Alistipes sp.]